MAGPVTETPASEVRGMKALTAVDLITIVVFAALFRLLFYIYKLGGFAFPFNHGFWYLFCSITLVPALIIVRKPLTTFLFTVGWLAINFFLQGEIVAWWICAVTVPLIPELYFWVRGKSFPKPGDVYLSGRDLFVGNLLYTILAYISNMYLIVAVQLTPVPMLFVWIVAAESLALGIIGGWLGSKLGFTLKGLVG